MRFSISVRDNQRLEFLGDAVLEICVTRDLSSISQTARGTADPQARRAGLRGESSQSRDAAGAGQLPQARPGRGGRRRARKPVDPCQIRWRRSSLPSIWTRMEEAAKLVDLGDGRLQTSEKSDRDEERGFCRNICRRWARKRRPTKSSGRMARRMPACLPRGFLRADGSANWHGHGRAQTACRRGRRADGVANAALRFNETRVRGYGKGSHRCG